MVFWPWQRPVLSGPAAQRHGLRVFTAHPFRSGPEQPCCLRFHQQTRLPQERRHGLAADRPIADISRAFIAAIEAPRETVHGQVFNVGITTENYRVREIAEIVRCTVPGSSIAYAEGAGTDKRSYRVDCSKISRCSCLSSGRNGRPRPGAKELYARYCEFGLAAEDFEGARYQRLAYLKSLLSRGLLDASLRWLPASQ